MWSSLETVKLCIKIAFLLWNRMGKRITIIASHIHDIWLVFEKKMDVGKIFQKKCQNIKVRRIGKQLLPLPVAFLLSNWLLICYEIMNYDKSIHFVASISVHYLILPRDGKDDQRNRKLVCDLQYFCIWLLYWITKVLLFKVRYII